MSEANARLQAALDKLIAHRSAVSVLEAGCGSTSHLHLKEEWRVTGIDISQNQLDRNLQLKEKILGDLQSHVWSTDSFDMIVSWDVLEHLPQPRKALENLVGGLKPEGLLVLALPNLYSLKGLVTKFTPFFFHEWFYRYIIGDKREKHEFDQFPTFLRNDVAPYRLRQFARQNGLAVIYCDIYEGPVQTFMRKRHAWANIAFAFIGGVSRLLSFGQMDLNKTDCILILQRTQIPPLAA